MLGVFKTSLGIISRIILSSMRRRVMSGGDLHGVKELEENLCGVP